MHACMNEHDPIKCYTVAYHVQRVAFVYSNYVLCNLFAFYYFLLIVRYLIKYILCSLYSRCIVV